MRVCSVPFEAHVAIMMCCKWSDKHAQMPLPSLPWLKIGLGFSEQLTVARYPGKTFGSLAALGKKPKPWQALNARCGSR